MSFSSCCYCCSSSSLLFKRVLSVFHWRSCQSVFLTKVGSLLRQDLVNSLKLFEKSPLSVGGGDLGIWKSTRIGCMSELGGSPLASSMAVMPSDQMSAWRGESHIFSIWQMSMCVWGDNVVNQSRGYNCWKLTLWTRFQLHLNWNQIHFSEFFW